MRIDELQALGLVVDNNALPHKPRRSSSADEAGVVIDHGVHEGSPRAGLVVPALRSRQQPPRE